MTGRGEHSVGELEGQKEWGNEAHPTMKEEVVPQRERLGYRLTMVALLIFFLGVVERRNWIAAVVVAIGFSLISYLVFATWLRVPLPVGPWGF